VRVPRLSTQLVENGHLEDYKLIPLLQWLSSTLYLSPLDSSKIRTPFQYNMKGPPW